MINNIICLFAVLLLISGQRGEVSIAGSYHWNAGEYEPKTNIYLKLAENGEFTYIFSSLHRVGTESCSSGKWRKRGSHIYLDDIQPCQLYNKGDTVISYFMIPQDSVSGIFYYNNHLTSLPIKIVVNDVDTISFPNNIQKAFFRYDKIILSIAIQLDNNKWDRREFKKGEQVQGVKLFDCLPIRIYSFGPKPYTHFKIKKDGSLSVRDYKIDEDGYLSKTKKEEILFLRKDDDFFEKEVQKGVYVDFDKLKKFKEVINPFEVIEKW